jgi:hypothetical protein
VWCITGLAERLKGTFAQLKTMVWRQKEGQGIHVSANSVTPVAVDFVREKSILREREISKSRPSANAAWNIKYKPINQSHKRA